MLHNHLTLLATVAATALSGGYALHLIDRWCVYREVELGRLWRAAILILGDSLICLGYSAGIMTFF